MKTNIITFTVSICIIVAVHYIEYIGYPPCDLCLKQRWPWYLVLIISFISLFLNKKLYPWNRFALIILFAGSTIFSGWHAGIEWGFWSGPTTCTSTNLAIISHSDFLGTIENIRSLVPCNEADFKILGLSLAVYNFISSLLMLIYTSLFMRKENERS